MKFTALTSLLMATAAAAPAPQASGGKDGYPAFGLMSLRSASPIHFAQTSAAHASLFLWLPKESQDAVCNGEDPGTAAFYLNSGRMFLYSGPERIPPQQVFVDRSGMGQGKLGYINPDQLPPRNAELEGWKVEENDILKFNGRGLIACPNSIEGSWSVWLDAGVAQPGGNSGCLPFSGRVVPLDNPISCHYSV